MRLAVNPTRMELMRLRKRLTLARRGYKLLKDKQEELMRRFMKLLGELKDSRRELEREITEVFRQAAFTRIPLPENIYENLKYFQKDKLEIDIKRKRLMNLNVPVFELRSAPNPYVYNLINTPSITDEFVYQFKNLIPKLVDIAGSEAAFVMVSDELEKTRRRVNALEYVLIPSLKETIAYIEMKLSELERSTLVRLMRVKEIVQAQ